MSIFSKTVYIEVEAKDEDEANAIVCEIVDTIRDSRMTNVDIAGPIEDVTEAVQG